MGDKLIGLEGETLVEPGIARAKYGDFVGVDSRLAEGEHPDVRLMELIEKFKLTTATPKAPKRKRKSKDKELFEKMKNDLKFIWDKILYFRHNNSQYLKEILNNKKAKIYNFKTKENEVVLNGFAIRNIENDY